MNWEDTTSYHGQPVIKEPVWTWEIPCYFFAGGLAGAGAGLAYLAELRGSELLARRAWAASLGALSLSPALLMSDLGRPERFLNMLRMFKVTSPMSVGSWILTGSGLSTALAAVNAWTGLFPGPARVAKPAAALLGLPLSTYTAALISSTAVPVWHEAHRTLPYLFGAGAALSAAGATLALTPPEHAAPARRLALSAALLETAGKDIMERRLGEHGQAYKQGAPARFSHLSRACIAAGSGLLLARGARSRAAAAAAGSLFCAGALAARWSVFKAGFRSAADPRFVVGPQRERIARGERRGASRAQPRLI